MAAPTFGKLLAVEMMFSFYFGVYSGTMLGALVEIVPAHVRTTCFSLAFALAAALFGTFTPFASTLLIEHTGDKASPGLLADVRRGARHHRRIDRLSRRPQGGDDVRCDRWSGAGGEPLMVIPGRLEEANPESISPNILAARWILRCAIAHQSSMLRIAPE